MIHAEWMELRPGDMLLYDPTREGRPSQIYLIVAATLFDVRALVRGAVIVLGNDYGVWQSTD